MDENKEPQKEPDRTDLKVKGLADSIHNYHITNQPIPNDKKLINKPNQSVKNGHYDWKVLAFNQRARLFTHAALNHKKEPHLPRPFFKRLSQWERERSDIVQAWRDYIGDCELEDWIRFCRDLGIEGELTTEKDCQQALKPLWVNICDFLWNADELVFFATEQELSVYSLQTGKVYPHRRIRNGEPLEELIANIKMPKKEKIKTREGKTKIPDIAACKTWCLDSHNWIVKSDFRKKD